MPYSVLLNPPAPPQCLPTFPVYPLSAPTLSPPLPLELTEGHVTVSIIDNHSWVTLSQGFYNPGTSIAKQVTYSFTVLAGSALYSFVMIHEDGRRVGGFMKEKEQAQRDLDAAIKAGQVAALGEEATKDGTHLHVN